ncbi:FLYWCH zinc finger domain-containing protein [Phthorimaea operculella]|nr:FLYWCH zinc finger domain-containing protein [Phthorimaea operculella]
MYADYDPVFTTSRFGKPAIQMGPYRFNRWSGSRGPRARWVCCKVHGGCKATIITLEEEIIKFPVYALSQRGKPVIQLGGYRFNKWSGSKGPRARWVCSRDHGGCRAKINTVEDVIVKFYNVHNH